jgi:hypothetical protein
MAFRGGILPAYLFILSGVIVGFCTDRAAAADIEQVNRALGEWLAEIEADRPYLVLDIGAQELRLEHGGARLRLCPLVETVIEKQGGEKVPLLSGRLELRQRLRRFRHNRGRSSGSDPFDWEGHLAVAANSRCALYFSGGLLVHADTVWNGSGVSTIRLAADDLQALYNALAPGAALVILPAGWDRLEEDASRRP